MELFQGALSADAASVFCPFRQYTTPGGRGQPVSILLAALLRVWYTAYNAMIFQEVTLVRRKRLLCLLLALTLALALVPGVQAAEDVFFVAVNDTIPLTLTGVAPYYSSGGLFVPYTVFDAAPGGVACAYNESEQTFVLFTRARRLVFDLSAQTVTDEEGNSSTTSVSYRGGVLYVPLGICASHFALSTSLLTSSGGYTVLRFTTGSQVYEDSLFIEKAENLISYRVAQLEQPDEPVTPVTPGRTDPPVVKQPEPETPAVEPAVCYLAITDAAGMQAAADVLAGQNLRAAFFLTQQEIEENPALVRALFVAGHTLGVTAEEDAQDLSAAFDAANEALCEVLLCKTVLALTKTAPEEPITGYRVISAAVAEEQTTPEPGSTQLLALGADAAQQISSLLQQGASLPLLRETTQLP